MTLAKFLRTGAAALGALAVATQANAADIYSGGLKDPVIVAPPPIWAGFYAGIHLGAAWTDYNDQRNWFYDRCFDVGCFTSLDPLIEYDSFATRFGGHGKSQTTAFGGGQIGYNFAPPTWSNVVLGIEVDIDGVGNDAEHTYLGNTYSDRFVNGVLDPLGPYLTGIHTARVSRQNGLAFDVTGRLGWSFGPALLYAKGGFAWLESKTSIRATSYDPISGFFATFASGNPWGTFSNDATLTGYTVGAGVEWLLNPNWSVKLEYLHFDFNGDNKRWDPITYYGPLTDATVFYRNNTWRFNNDVSVDTIKLGINYHVVNYVAPLK